MLAFLKENWILIAIPFVVVFGVLIAFGACAGDETNPFSYNVF